ncbi:hypothetical protein OH491_01345 [Termitidicoccus mucosus]|uniref:Sialate O-acetylesterase domain-containing protein n=1 Tax=Termitidicoccus mucosus TaxID=1184151 RepID=A0A178IMB7_9BACT|nr:hypothetical protein AW736_08200 [Opitutaceae bacterium TSB47]
MTKSKSPACFLIIGAALAVGWSIVVEVKPTLPQVFADHMVFQRDMPAPVWGTADVAEIITVEFAGQKKQTTTGADGRWLVRFNPLDASAEPRELAVTGKTKDAAVSRVRFADVVVGEVWLCAGQSNMEMPLIGERSLKPILGADEAIRMAEFPQIRMLKIKKTRAGEPASDINLASPWIACSPNTINTIKFSAAGFLFGRKHQQKSRKEPRTPQPHRSIQPVAECRPAAAYSGWK